MTKHSHYKRDVSHLKTIDVYRIIELFEITCPVAQHVLKKSMAAGQRGHKDLQQDWQDILDSAERRLQMLDEDAQPMACDWITWAGGECPVLPDTLVEMRGRGGVGMTGRAWQADWLHSGSAGDIIAYRVIAP